MVPSDTRRVSAISAFDMPRARRPRTSFSRPVSGARSEELGVPAEELRTWRTSIAAMRGESELVPS